MTGDLYMGGKGLFLKNDKTTYLAATDAETVELNNAGIAGIRITAQEGPITLDSGLGRINAKGANIISLAEPTNSTDAATKGYVDKLGLPIVTTEGDGAAYTATVPGITALTAGASFIMIPHTVSTSTTPTLNVNSLGAKNIKRGLSSLSSSNSVGYSSSWLVAGYPSLWFMMGRSGRL